MPGTLQSDVAGLRRISADIDRIQSVKRRSAEAIDDISTELSIEVANTTKTLFVTDRRIAQALKQVISKTEIENMERVREEIESQRPIIERDLIARNSGLVKQGERAVRREIDAEVARRITARERQEKASRPAVVSFQGRTFTIDQLDPKKIIEQRALTNSEEAALNKIVNRVQRLEAFATQILKDTTTEIELLNQYADLLKSVSLGATSRIRQIIQNPDEADQQVAADAQDTIQDMDRKTREIESILKSLKILRGKAIRLRATAKNVARLADRVTSRTDIESFLGIITGAGAITALGLSLASATTVAGWVALPTLIAFGILRAIKLVRTLVS